MKGSAGTAEKMGEKGIKMDYRKVSDCLGVDQVGHLTISGADAVLLAQEYGTPLYVLSEDKVRDTCRRYKSSFVSDYDGFGTPIYASKAFCCKEILRVVTEEGLDVEVVSGGEIATALAAGVDPKKLHFQGNNKSETELILALDRGVGDIVVDNITELHRLDRLAAERGIVPKISLRIKPGIDAHTHAFIRTGQIDSKFGFALETGEAMEAAREAVASTHLELVGLHCHIGSQVFDHEPFVLAAKVMLGLFAQIRSELGKTMTHLNLGGGFGVRYKEDDAALPYESYMDDVSKAVHQTCRELGLEIPKIFIEPGRSVVAEAGVTLYTVGDIKTIPGVRTYVAIDGGMFENPRYALYQSDYTCLIANRADQPADFVATVAGKCCESGDLIQEHTPMQKPEVGDVLAVLSTGAYNYSMASNYNRNLRPACVMVKNGRPRVIIRRETYEDLLRLDV